MNEDLRQLRKKIDGSDLFMKSYQIKKIRTREKVVPIWATNNIETRKLLLRAFPKLKIDYKQRQRAGRWSAVIHMFYRMGMAKSQIAEELKTTTTTINTVLQHIRRVAKGRRADNKGLLGIRPAGRPKRDLK